MSSADVRQAIVAAVETAAAPWDVYDLSDYVSLEDVLQSVTDNAVLVQFITADEFVASIGGEGNQGWEESGTVVLHLMVPAGFPSDEPVTKGDEIREALRGTRPGAKITIESCAPFSDFGAGATGMYGGAWKGWASNMFYVRRDCG